MSSVTDLKGLYQVTELQLVNLAGLNTKSLVLYDTTCSNSWEAGSLTSRLDMHGKALKLTVKVIKNKQLIDTRVGELWNQENIRVPNHLPLTPSLKRTWMSAQVYLRLRPCRRLTHI